jgi:hypothetical protein
VLGSAEDIHDEHQGVGAAYQWDGHDPVHGLVPLRHMMPSSITVTPSLRRRLRTPGFRSGAKDGSGAHGIGGIGPWGGWPGGTGELIDDPSIMGRALPRTTIADARGRSQAI